MKAIFLLAFLCVVSPVLCDIWTSCGTANDDFTITSVIITPDPPTKGNNLTVSVVGTMKKTVTSGTVSLDVKYGIITVFNHNEPLCGSPSPITCPINAGQWKQSVTEFIDKSAPSGSYTATAKFVDQSSNEIACVNVAFKLA